MKYLTLLLALSTAFVCTAQTLKTVGFRDDPQNGHYGSFVHAVASAQDGDTLQVYPGTYTSPSSVTIDKALTIIGPGYFQASNYLGATTMPGWAQLPNIYVDAAGKNVTIRSCYVPSHIRIYDAATIFVANNYIRAVVVEKSDVAVIHGNFFYTGGYGRPGGHGGAYAAQVYNTSSMTLTNNIFKYSSSNYDNFYSQGHSSIYNSSRHSYYASVGSATISHNLFSDNIYLNTGYLFHSNLMDANAGSLGCSQPNGAVYYNNAGVYTPSSSGCSSTAYLGGLSFPYEMVDYYGTNGYSLDGRYQLTANSQARGAGLNGTDCGPFGGDDPYQLSGISDIPFVWQLNVPQNNSQSNGADVNINIKATN